MCTMHWMSLQFKVCISTDAFSIDQSVPVHILEHTDSYWLKKKKKLKSLCPPICSRCLPHPEPSLVKWSLPIKREFILPNVAMCSLLVDHCCRIVGSLPYGVTSLCCFDLRSAQLLLKCSYGSWNMSRIQHMLYTHWFRFITVGAIGTTVLGIFCVSLLLLLFVIWIVCIFVRCSFSSSHLSRLYSIL